MKPNMHLVHCQDHANDDPILREHANAIRDLSRKTIEHIIEMGRRFTEAQELVGHGRWCSWLKREFGWTDRTALNYMRVFEMTKSETISDLKLSIPIASLYLLAAPSVPESARLKAFAL